MVFVRLTWIPSYLLIHNLTALWPSFASCWPNPHKQPASIFVTAYFAAVVMACHFLFSFSYENEISNFNTFRVTLFSFSNVEIRVVKVIINHWNWFYSYGQGRIFSRTPWPDALWFVHLSFFFCQSPIWFWYGIDWYDHISVKWWYHNLFPRKQKVKLQNSWKI